MSDGMAIHRFSTLPAADAAAVTSLVDAAAAVDGFSALDEAATLRLTDGHADVAHLLATGSDGLLGYAQLHGLGDQVGALVVHPDRRGAGVGDALLTRMLGEAEGRLQIWATHDTSGARELARRHALRVGRRLLIMDRALDGDWSPAAPPPDVIIRPFRPGTDEDAWLAVNARAFAFHPEQGRITRGDLEQRKAQPWFDPDGFLVAERDDPAGAHRAATMIGFHWTKQHEGTLGEVYVLGVDPAAGVRGLGRPLLVAGLDHLRSVGDERVHLYVEGDNEPALKLYERAGFTVRTVNVMYTRDE